MDKQTKLSELSSFDTEYIITNSFDDAIEIHGILQSILIDGNKINDILLTRSHIFITLNNNRMIYINFNKMPKFFDL